MSDYIPIIEDANKFPSTTSGAVVGRQVLIISGNNTVAASTAASALVCGVALFDAASGVRITVSRDPVQELTAVGAITAGDALEAAAGGGVATHTLGTNDNRIVGYALTTAADAALVRVLWTK